ncbi:unnamed protein product [Rotaria magnacalcarata]|uniref:ABC transporter domain-containing protein n=4 Tax=Rotaria magnacalcarata TaxID=392030 RepID=A0A817ABR8_9BILA|nr:unnamed protein product [Rotaria magnacalcarata]
MDQLDNKHQHSWRFEFINHYRALFLKMFLLTKRNLGQTIAEIFLACVFMGLLLGMRFVLDRDFNPAYQIPSFYPQDTMLFSVLDANITYYYPKNPCTTAIVTNAIAALSIRWPTFSTIVQGLSNPNISSLSNDKQATIYAFIYFTNINSCLNPSNMPDTISYTLRMQENGPYYYRAQSVKINPNIYRWKRSPEDFCQDNSTTAMYSTAFLDIQYFIDLSIIQYSTNISQNSLSMFMNHFGCPAYFYAAFQSEFGFFIPILFSFIFIMTFILNVGYIVDERRNKAKEYSRIFGLRTWINNLVWVTRSMFIYIVLCSLLTGLSVLVLPSSNATSKSVDKAVFNYTHWTVIWTVLFVYSIQLSTFSVFFGQFFSRPLLAKFLSFTIWILTFIDFYNNIPVVIRYLMCFFPNTGLLFCLEVIQQYERKSGNMTTFKDFYSNLFTYPLYIGICLLLMIAYSIIYMVLAVYIERINPGQFGVSQPFFYPCLRKNKISKTIPISYSDENGSLSTNRITKSKISKHDHWIEMDSTIYRIYPLIRIKHLTKEFGRFTAVSNFSVDFYEGEVCALLGHNGAGKTTITFVLVGMLHWHPNGYTDLYGFSISIGMMEATSGRVLLQGLDHRIHIQQTRKMIGFCPQYDILYDKLSVQEHLELFSQMRNLDRIKIDESIDKILDLIGLVNDRRTLSKDLSGGMKRRLSIGISLIGDPKVSQINRYTTYHISVSILSYYRKSSVLLSVILILDEPTSGVDPYNRRLIWMIIQKMKDIGKCVILTTHFLEEADILSDRIVIMSHGRLQASGTPDFLKQQTDYEYRLFIDKQDACNRDIIVQSVQQIIQTVDLERETSSELVFGIKRGSTQRIAELIRYLYEQRQQLAINGYGLSMATIEEVFLRIYHCGFFNLIAVFSLQYSHISGIRLFHNQVWALFVKQLILTRRQISFLIGFFLIPMLLEILIVAILPTPITIQTSILQNERVVDAQVQLQPSIYNPHTTIIYANNNASSALLRLNTYLTNTNAAIDQISANTIVNKVVSEWTESEEIFVNKYQMGFGIFNNLTSTNLLLTFEVYFSTINYHTMATSLNVATTNLFQFYANSSLKSIVTTNQPLLTNEKLLVGQDLFFEMIYCFDTLPLSLFNFINSILAAIFIGILSSNVIRERLTHSKDLQLLTRLSKFTYWFSTAIYDFALCLILCSILTIIVKISAVYRVDSGAEVEIYVSNQHIGYFFLIFLLYSLTSLPFVYVYSFIPGTELIGFVIYFIVNVLVCFVDVVLGFIGVFSGSKTLPNGTKVNQTGTLMTNIRWILSALFPTVNLKHALFNIRLRSSDRCVGPVNSVMGTNYSLSESWLSLSEPGLGMQCLIFIGQSIFWWFIVMFIEEGWKIGWKKMQYCFKRQQQQSARRKTNEWNDQQLDTDVRNERQLILNQSQSTSSAIVIVQDLVHEFQKPKEASSTTRIHRAVDHLNFFVPPSSCFGLLGANGAGKTTTFRLLINSIQPTSGEVFINRTENKADIGYCPQFDWLVDHLNVRETLTLFARLKGLTSADINEIHMTMIQCFGLDTNENQQVQNLSGGNKRKLSASLAFMANPTLIFLDEPTTGLDAAAKRKVWNVIRTARDAGLTIIMTSHSMEECEALCTKIGIMKAGQFLCLGSLQHLKNRFGNGYVVQVKVSIDKLNRIKDELEFTLPGIKIEDEKNGMLFCHVPVSTIPTDHVHTTSHTYNLANVFEFFNQKKENNDIESYSLTQTTLEQIFVSLTSDENENHVLLSDLVANENCA